MEQAFIALQSGIFSTVIMPLLVVAATIVAAKIVGTILSRHFCRVSRQMRVNETQFAVLRRLVVLIVYFVGLLIAASMVPALQAASVSIFASAGIIAIVIGFATQKALSNVISGIFIAFTQPFRVGDRVTISKEYGTVEDITLRHTVIKTWDDRRLIIPNSKVDEDNIINYTIGDPRILRTIEIGISYDSDIDLARKTMLEEVLKHENVIEGFEKHDFLGGGEKAKVRVKECSDFSVTMRLYFWAKDQPTAVVTGYELLEAIKKRFDREGVEIPFPYRTLVYKKDLKKPKKIKGNAKKQEK